MSTYVSIIRSPEWRAHLIESLMDAQLPIQVEWGPYKKPRSIPFNRFYFVSIVTPLAAHCGESPAETHRLLCGDYWGWVMKEFNGHMREVPRRTTTTNEEGKRDVLPWDQMSNFVEHSRSVAGMMGMPISMQEAG
jgi:hypothetical protein